MYPQVPQEGQQAQVLVHVAPGLRRHQLLDAAVPVAQVHRLPHVPARGTTRRTTLTAGGRTSVAAPAGSLAFEGRVSECRL